MSAVLPLEPTLGRCRRCGKLSSLSAAFCPRCGIRLREVDALQAEVLDDEPAAGNWEILDSAPQRGRGPWPVMPIPVIPKAPSLPFAPIAPNWSAPRPFGKKRRVWLPILIGFIVIRSMASWSASSNPPMVRTPAPSIRTTPVVYPAPISNSSGHVRH